MYSKVYFVCIVLMCVAGCARGPITAAELASDFRQLASSAAETDLFIGQLQKGKLTRAFAEAHAAYLRGDVKEAQQSVEKAIPAAGLEPAFHEYRQQQSLLWEQLNHLSANLNDPRVLKTVRQTTIQIQRDCDEARARL